MAKELQWGHAGAGDSHLVGNPIYSLRIVSGLVIDKIIVNGMHLGGAGGSAGDALNMDNFECIYAMNKIGK